MRQCHRCGAEWVGDKRQPGPKEFCAQCTAYLHCCKNCKFHDTSAHNECRIPNTEWVGDRAGCNFCDEFEFADTQPGATRGDVKKAQARDALRSLFDGDADTMPTGADAFDKLFGG